MLIYPRRQEIDHRTIKLTIGVIALTLAGLTSSFSNAKITSISASYYEGGWAQSIFIGFLFAIAALMLAYNGMSKTEMILSKLASFAGAGVAMFPCGCGSHTELIPYVHSASASIMFLILAYFCYKFYLRAKDKPNKEARLRAVIYGICGFAILLSIFTLGLDSFTGEALSKITPRLTFYGEATGLIAFGISWLTASRTIPMLTKKDERFSPFRQDNPG